MNEIELKSALGELKKTPIEFNLMYSLVNNKFNITLALKEIGRSKGWFYGLPDERQKFILDVAGEYNSANKLRALEILDQAAPKAADVQVKLLDSRDERVRQAAAKEVLDRGVGKVTDKIDVTTQGEKVNSLDGYDRAISTLANAIRKSIPGQGTESDGKMDTSE